MHPPGSGAPPCSTDHPLSPLEGVPVQASCALGRGGGGWGALGKSLLVQGVPTFSEKGLGKAPALPPHPDSFLAWHLPGT